MDALGGAIDLRGREALAPATGATVRARREELASKSVKVREGRALIPSLVPGVWRVELCGAEGCAAPVYLGPVEVVRGQTLLLEAGE